ncbi:MAG: hypothetical protein Q4C30_00640 [Bacteroidia bacterium]|nr:hypothetical protein [Bacteroidia bacterium]
MKIRQYLALGIVLMGFIHLIATFSPIIAGKLAPLELASRHAFTYMSSMCGLMLMLGGLIIVMLADKEKEHKFLKIPMIITETMLVINGISAVCFMPSNPCAWIVIVLALPIPFISDRIRK